MLDTEDLAFEARKIKLTITIAIDNDSYYYYTAHLIFSPLSYLFFLFFITK